MPEIKLDITEYIAVLSESSKGWKKELNLISWNGNAPKYDIRDWSLNHEKMGKGVTLTLEELEKLKKVVIRFKNFTWTAFYIRGCPCSYKISVNINFRFFCI